MNKKRLYWILGVGIGAIIVCVILIFVLGCSIWGHAYKQCIVDATCTDEGRVINTCKLCGDN